VSGARRGRPPNPELREGRREQLVRSAYAVVTEMGFEHMAMSDIARHAGVGQGTVYRYFSSKRELLDAVFDYAVAKTVDALDLGSLSEEDVVDFDRAVDLISTFGRRLFALVDADPNILRLITVDSSAIDSELRYRVLGMLGAVDAGLSAIFERTSPDWSATADPDVRKLYGRMMFAMSGPGLFMSLLGETGTDEREVCLSTMTKIANAGILLPADDGEQTD
jgi:AcrR family transcriptional regulator